MTWIPIIGNAFGSRKRKKRIFNDLETAITGEALDWSCECKNLSKPPESVNRHYASIYETVIGETRVILQENEYYDVDGGYPTKPIYHYSMIVHENDGVRRFHGKKVKTLFERAKEDYGRNKR